jgi:Lrp/AsnC family leucine-responsive transcriptional regulator
MAFEFEKLLDETGWRLLHELQENARLSYRELGDRVGLSSPAVAERITKMEEAGLISGYHVEINFKKLGLPVAAIVYLANIGGQTCKHVADELMELPEVVEVYRLTGSDSIILKVIATSVDHLATVIDQVSAFGIPTTSIVRSTPMTRKTIDQSPLERGIEVDELTL